jgi:hypothetical protein
MSNETVNTAVKEFREKFLAMPPAQQELVMLDIVKGINSMSGSFLAAMTNDTFAATVLGNSKLVANNDGLYDLLKLLCNLCNLAEDMKDLEDAKLMDVQVPELTENIRGCMRYTRSVFNKVMLTEDPKKYTTVDNVVYPVFGKR